MKLYEAYQYLQKASDNGITDEEINAEADINNSEEMTAGEIAIALGKAAKQLLDKEKE